tara:strand:- start:16 stop:159 length:144 start_codon:yes stop_codon:yes gene_type:complete
MIVGSVFDGDIDYALQEQQHDCYREALTILVKRCIKHYKAASHMLNI